MSTTTTHPYPRADLAAHGVASDHTHVCEWVSDDGQADLVVGLGDSAQSARSNAEAESIRVGLTGGSLEVRPISVDLLADEECAGEDWWDSLYRNVDLERGQDSPQFFTRVLRELREGTSTVTVRELRELTSLPGWHGGPDFAPHPLLIR